MWWYYLLALRGMHLLWKCSEDCFVFLLNFVTLQSVSLSSLCRELLGFIIYFSFLPLLSYISNILPFSPFSCIFDFLSTIFYQQRTCAQCNYDYSFNKCLLSSSKSNCQIIWSLYPFYELLAFLNQWLSFPISVNYNCKWQINLGSSLFFSLETHSKLYFLFLHAAQTPAHTTRGFNQFI